MAWLTEDERAELRRLHAQGLGRNEIARRLGRGSRSVSVVAAELGLSFDRAATEEATRARQADLAERRALLAEALQSDAERLTEQLWQPSKIYNFGGKDNEYNERDVPEPPADAKRALMGAAGMAIDRSLRLVPPAADESGLDAARSMLTGLAEGVRRIAEAPEDAGEG